MGIHSVDAPTENGLPKSACQLVMETSLQCNCLCHCLHLNIREPSKSGHGALRQNEVLCRKVAVYFAKSINDFLTPYPYSQNFLLKCNLKIKSCGIDSMD